MQFGFTEKTLLPYSLVMAEKYHNPKASLTYEKFNLEGVNEQVYKEFKDSLQSFGNYSRGEKRADTRSFRVLINDNRDCRKGFFRKYL